MSAIRDNRIRFGIAGDPRQRVVQPHVALGYRAAAAHGRQAAAQAERGQGLHLVKAELAPQVRVNGIAPGPVLWPEAAAIRASRAIGPCPSR